MHPSPVHGEGQGEEVFLDESDIINEYDGDDEELPDVYDGLMEKKVPMLSMIQYTYLLIIQMTVPLLLVELYTAACSPTDPTLVATGGGDDEGFLWKINVGDCTFSLEGHQDSVSCLAFSVDGQLLASGGLDGVVKIWDTAGGDLKCTLEGPTGNTEMGI